MNEEIKNRFNDKVIVEAGKYTDIREACEQNKAHLWGAVLRGADLRGADLREAVLWRARLRGADLRGAVLWQADLRETHLRGTDLREANLRKADLRGADLWEAKNYYNSHDFAQEIIYRQKIDYFTDKEWSFIGKLLTHRFCWGRIRKYKIAESVCEKIAKLGWDEYLTQFKAG